MPLTGVCMSATLLGLGHTCGNTGKIINPIISLHGVVTLSAIQHAPKWTSKWCIRH